MLAVASLLGGGAEVAPASAQSLGARPEWIDFEFYRDSRMFIPVTVNGFQTVGVLDSGAPITAIDEAVAASAGIRPAGTTTATGTGGSRTVGLARGVTVEIGGLVMEGLTVAIADLTDVADRLLGRPLPIIIGAEVFERAVVDIDYARRRVALRDPARWEYEGAGAVVPLGSSGGKRFVTLRIEGGDPVVAGFDLGQGAPLTILKPHADEIRLLHERPSGTVRAGGFGGSTLARIVSLERVELGGVRFEDVPTLVPTEAIGAFNTTRMQANLGTGILSRFRTIVDYARDRLILEPQGGVGHPPFPRNRSGVYLQRAPEGLVVAHVSEGSPAAAAGVPEGERLVAINGALVGQDYWTGGLWRWSDQPAGTEVKLQMASGEVFAVQLTDYY